MKDQHDSIFFYPPTSLENTKSKKKKSDFALEFNYSFINILRSFLLIFLFNYEQITFIVKTTDSININKSTELKVK